MRISSKRQISIPKNIMTVLNLKPGDEVDIQIEEGTARLIPVTTIKVPRDQAWFWTKEWQEKERRADEDISSGKFRDFDNLDALLKDLNSENQKN
jgi:antitoxin MazE